MDPNISKQAIDNVLGSQAVQRQLDQQAQQAAGSVDAGTVLDAAELAVDVAVDGFDVLEMLGDAGEVLSGVVSGAGDMLSGAGEMLGGVGEALGGVAELAGDAGELITGVLGGALEAVGSLGDLF